MWDMAWASSLACNRSGIPATRLLTSGAKAPAVRVKDAIRVSLIRAEMPGQGFWVLQWAQEAARQTQIAALLTCQLQARRGGTAFLMRSG